MNRTSVAAHPLVLGDTIDRAQLRRWALSAGFVAALHALLLLAALFWYAQYNVPGTGSSPVMIDLDYAPPTPDARPDAVPGPEMQQSVAADAKQEEQKAVEQEQLPPAPPAVQPDAVLAPLEQKETQKPTKEKPKEKSEKQKVANTPAPRTTAPSPAAQAAQASYTGALSAHLQRHKQYPPASRSAGEQGVAMLTFTVSRNGQVLASRIAKSSGFPALDAETMAMIRRAQPLPSFPPDMAQASLSVTVPIRFAIK